MKNKFYSVALLIGISFFANSYASLSCVEGREGEEGSRDRIYAEGKTFWASDWNSNKINHRWENEYIDASSQLRSFISIPMIAGKTSKADYILEFDFGEGQRCSTTLVANKLLETYEAECFLDIDKAQASVIESFTTQISFSYEIDEKFIDKTLSARDFIYYDPDTQEACFQQEGEYGVSFDESFDDNFSIDWSSIEVSSHLYAELEQGTKGFPKDGEIKIGVKFGGASFNPQDGYFLDVKYIKNFSNPGILKNTIEIPFEYDLETGEYAAYIEKSFNHRDYPKLIYSLTSAYRDEITEARYSLDHIQLKIYQKTGTPALVLQGDLDIRKNMKRFITNTVYSFVDEEIGKSFIQPKDKINIEQRFVDWSKIQFDTKYNLPENKVTIRAFIEDIDQPSEAYSFDSDYGETEFHYDSLTRVYQAEVEFYHGVDDGRGHRYEYEIDIASILVHSGIQEVFFDYNKAEYSQSKEEDIKQEEVVEKKPLSKVEKAVNTFLSKVEGSLDSDEAVIQKLEGTMTALDVYAEKKPSFTTVIHEINQIIQKRIDEINTQ